MDNEFLLAAQERMRVRQEAESLLGMRAWSLVSHYGKLMSGPHSGHYVNALTPDEQRALLKQLVHGEVVHVHLMHRHRSGNYESSRLRWSEGKLFMVFKDREVAA